MKIINIGPYPPPYGGVAIHIKRLTEYLHKKNLVASIINTSESLHTDKKYVINIRSKRNLLLYLLKEEKCIVHFHNFSFKHLLFMFGVSLKHTVVVSIHNEDFKYLYIERFMLIRKIMTFFINRLSGVILDNKPFLDLMRKYVNAKKLYYIPEYIHQTDIEDLSEKHILSFRRNVKFLIASNATRLAFFNNQDLYGIDLMVELMNNLVNKFNINVGLILVVPNIDNKEYFLKIKKLIKEYQLEQNFLLFNDSLDNIISLWKMADIVVRPTNTDGNALTVLEALAERTIVIASDCVQRPQGTVLFENRNLKSFTQVVEHVLENLASYNERMADLRVDNNAENFLQLYEKIF